MKTWKCTECETTECAVHRVSDDPIAWGRRCACERGHISKSSTLYCPLANNAFRAFRDSCAGFSRYKSPGYDIRNGYIVANSYFEGGVEYIPAPPELTSEDVQESDFED